MKVGMSALRGMAAAVLAVVLCSCGGSDGNSNGSSLSVVGTWNFVSATLAGITITTEEMGSTMVLHINADGTYSAVTTDEDGTEIENGTWSVNGNTITFSGEGAPQSAPYTVSGGTLTLTYSEDGQSITMVFNSL